jgi:large subunit ribosomal protein L32e
MRKNLKYRPSKVRVGFRGPKETRDLHSSGFQEVVVNNVYDLEIIDPKIQAARIGSSVGTKKRLDIKKKAEELDIRILNL